MARGIQCGDGWYDIIYQLSRKLEDAFLALTKEEMHKAIEEFKCTAAQVKEKFGGLRFYLDGGTPAMFEATLEAESLAYTTCEMCGETGETRRNGWWIKTLCDACHQRREEERRKSMEDVKD
jgi:hypothetical protein